MAIYHCSIKNISRSSGRSAVASSAYRAGEKLEDRETGLTHDYTNKKEVAYSEIILCENAPREYADRETLWNAVEEIEKQSNARLAREWEVALPNELTFEQGRELVKEFAQSLADEGMCVDMAIHWKDGNHHAHIMGTTRPIKENGEWGQKEKKAYKLDENGQKIPQIDPTTGKQKVRVRKGKGEEKLWERETVEVNDWNRTEKVEEWRERWADQCNKALEKAQSLERVDHRSFERQGIERIPTIHEGYVARQMEQKGQSAERCEINRDINAANIELQNLEAEHRSLLEVLKQLKEKVKEALKNKEVALNERLQRLRTTRATDEPVGRNANGDRPVQADNRRSAERSVEERLSALRSARTGRNIEQSVGETIGELLGSIEAERSNQQAEERQSAEIRDDKVTEREDRDTIRERHRAEEQRRIEKAQREAEAREIQRRARSYDRGPSH